MKQGDVKWLAKIAQKEGLAAILIVRTISNNRNGQRLSEEQEKNCMILNFWEFGEA